MKKQLSQMSLMRRAVYAKDSDAFPLSLRWDAAKRVSLALVGFAFRMMSVLATTSDDFILSTNCSKNLIVATDLYPSLFAQGQGVRMALAASLAC
jgi:hypothetical protein